MKTRIEALPVILCCAAASRWYLSIGTLLSIVVIALLLIPRIRSLQ